MDGFHLELERRGLVVGLHELVKLSLDADGFDLVHPALRQIVVGIGADLDGGWGVDTFWVEADANQNRTFFRWL